METIISNPDLYHLVEKVFWNLDIGGMNIDAQIDQSCNTNFAKSNILFFNHLSKKNQNDWINVIQSLKSSDKGIAIIAFLKWNLKKGIFNLPCYSSPTVQDDFIKTIWKCCRKEDLSDEENNIVKILAHLTDKPNTPDEYGRTAIYLAAQNGHAQIVKILMALSDNSNCPDNYGDTPIYWAARRGHTEIFKILAPLTDNPNAPNTDGNTPIYFAAHSGYTEIV